MVTVTETASNPMGWRNVARVNVFVRPLIPDVDYVNASYRPKSLSRLRRKSVRQKSLKRVGDSSV
jgi:hypothetical protein